MTLIARKGFFTWVCLFKVIPPVMSLWTPLSRKTHIMTKNAKIRRFWRKTLKRWRIWRKNTKKLWIWRKLHPWHPLLKEENLLNTFDDDLAHTYDKKYLHSLVSFFYKSHMYTFDNILKKINFFCSSVFFSANITFIIFRILSRRFIFSIFPLTMNNQ